MNYTHKAHMKCPNCYGVAFVQSEGGAFPAALEAAGWTVGPNGYQHIDCDTADDPPVPEHRQGEPFVV